VDKIETIKKAEIDDKKIEEPPEKKLNAFE
jgi:hypothetical protein